jgi:hypothetical protein
MAPPRLIAHVKLCVLALLLGWAAEIRGRHTGRTIRPTLDRLRVVRYRLQGKTIVQSTQVTSPMAEILQSLGIPSPKKLPEVFEEASTAQRPSIHASQTPCVSY